MKRFVDERPFLLTRTAADADPRSARKRQERPVTPEVAGSSPVAPAFDTALLFHRDVGF
jgi:hypothetical protein